MIQPTLYDLATRGALVRDTFSGWYIAPFVVLFAYLGSAQQLDEWLNLWLLLVPVLLLPVIVVAVWWMIMLLRHLIKKRWRRFASLLAAPVVAFLAVWSAWKVGINPDQVRFLLTQGSYRAAVDHEPRGAGQPRIEAFDWASSGGAATVNIFRTLVFDESDEIRLPPSRWSASWRARAKAESAGSRLFAILEARDREITTKRVGTHFYIVSQIFDGSQ